MENMLPLAAGADNHLVIGDEAEIFNSLDRGLNSGMNEFFPLLLDIFVELEKKRQLDVVDFGGFSLGADLAEHPIP